MNSRSLYVFLQLTGWFGSPFLPGTQTFPCASSPCDKILQAQPHIFFACLEGEICYYGCPHVRLRRFGGVGEGLTDMEKQGIGHSLKRIRTLHYLVTSLIKTMDTDVVYIRYLSSLLAAVVLFLVRSISLYTVSSTS